MKTGPEKGGERRAVSNRSLVSLAEIKRLPIRTPILRSDELVSGFVLLRGKRHRGLYGHWP